MKVKCKSTFCIINPDGIRGRLFTPPKDATSIAQVWCPTCIKLTSQIAFFTSETAEMIRKTYRIYTNTDLPKEVKLILEQFTREVVQNLGEEL